MLRRLPLLAAAASLAIPGSASAQSTRLDLDRLTYAVVHGAAQQAVLATDADGRPLSFLLRIDKGKMLPPHGATGPVRLLTVLSGTLSWGDGASLDKAAERRFGPGSVIVIPAEGGEHWAAARDGDVLLQVVLVRDGALSPAAAAQVAR